ncbi:hypothetical protein EPN83_01190 [Patescibacteria group bacterium]|nr:MAG: hypothetical protein EPN83_01190 [Patescibacteria group bacterium]
MDNTLRAKLRDIRGLRDQFEDCLLGNDSTRWTEEAKRFLRREPCWVPIPKRAHVVPRSECPNCGSFLEVLDKKLSCPVCGYSTAEQTLTETEPKTTGIKLYFHPKQKEGGLIKGYDLEKHLRETGIINRCLSLKDEEVKGWLANPTPTRKSSRVRTFSFGEAFGTVAVTASSPLLSGATSG